MKRGIVNPDLLEEKQKCNFDKEELARFIFGPDVFADMQELAAFIKNEPKMQVDINYLEESRNA